MIFYRIDSLDELVQGSFGILEPIGNINKMMKPQEIELFLVPGIAFDKSGNRIGYGKGFYDKYLYNLSSIKIGICFKEQMANSLENFVDDNDIKMDKIFHD